MESVRGLMQTVRFLCMKLVTRWEPYLLFAGTSRILSFLGGRKNYKQLQITKENWIFYTYKAKLCKKLHLSWSWLNIFQIFFCDEKGSYKCSLITKRSAFVTKKKWGGGVKQNPKQNHSGGFLLTFQLKL